MSFVNCLEEKKIKESKHRNEINSDIFSDLKIDEEKIIFKEFNSQNENKNEESQNETNYNDLMTEIKFWNFFISKYYEVEESTNECTFFSLILFCILFEHLFSFIVSSIIFILFPIFEYANFYLFYYSVNHGYKLFFYGCAYNQMDKIGKISSLMITILLITCINFYNNIYLCGHIILFPYTLAFYHLIFENYYKNNKRLLNIDNIIHNKNFLKIMAHFFFIFLFIYNKN